jgi:PAS domain S-box-containing protein
MTTEAPSRGRERGNERGNGRLLRRVDAANLPIGIYAVDREGRFLACNATARRILGLGEGSLDASIADLHVDVDGHAERVAEAERGERAGGHYEKAIVHLRVGEREIYAEDYLRPERDAGGELLGYVGCLVDITEEHLAAQRSFELQQKVEDLTLDIGRILHANTSTLLMVNQTLGAAAETLDPRLDVGEAGSATPQERVPKLAAGLAQAVERLVNAGEPARREEALPRERWALLENQVGLLRDYEKRIPVAEMRNPALRTSATEIARACRAIAPHLLPREPVRDALRQALELQRMLCFLDVQMTRTTVVQMDFTLRALRDFITAEVRPPDTPMRLSVAALVQESIAQLAEFARVSNVEIVWRRGPSLFVRGSERDILRALSNLLHNAIKYSWQRDRANAPWVSIRTDERADSMAAIEFETWGVPITPDEIEQGLIYQMGYRGKWSTDRGRLGTGIGLTDAQRVAQVHGGDVRVESKPATSTSLSPDDAAYYRHPFLTRVTLLLPAVE